MLEIIRTESIPEIYTEERCFITEILNAEEFPDISVAQARVRPGVTTALHKLRDTDEKYYVLKGTGEMVIDGKITGRIQAGDLVIISRNITQSVKNTGSDDLVFLCICTPRFQPKNYEAAE
jgi:mannose-6-phosphate isomerase-like protein (cupin superfamily)